MGDNGQVPAALTDPRHIAAWQAIANGSTYDVAAKRAEVSRSAIDKWVVKWREAGIPLPSSDRLEAARAQTAMATEHAKIAYQESVVAIAERLQGTLTEMEHGLEECGHVDPARSEWAPDDYAKWTGGVKNLAVTVGVLFDKVQLSQGKPTAIEGRDVTDLELVREWTATLGAELTDEIAAQRRKKAS